MAFGTGYRGAVNGSVQSSYTDQPGVAIAGMLAFASDINNCDAIFIGETNGIAAGKGVRLVKGNEGFGFQRPNGVAFLPESDEAATEFGGIVVFDEAMQSDENGIPGWAKGRVARLLRPGRAGGRVYVKAIAAVDVDTATVNWVIKAGTDGKYEAGEFTPAALAGTAAAGYSVALTNAKWVTDAAAGDLAMIELFGNVVPVLSTDDSSL